MGHGKNLKHTSSVDLAMDTLNEEQKKKLQALKDKDIKIGGHICHCLEGVEILPNEICARCGGDI